jgi:hypothetical protein
MGDGVAMRLDAATPPTLFVVHADPEPDQLEEFRLWYDEVHGPDALANGSFVALNRFAAVGAGHVAAPFLALWEGTFADETEAWAYIRPRAMELRAAGRAGDIASVAFAIMLVRARTFAASARTEPVRSLVTVQSDWRDSPGAQTADEWWQAAALDDAPPSELQWFVTGDPAGRGTGYHLATFASSEPVEATMRAWKGFGTPGMSPVPSYKNIFGIEHTPKVAQPERATAWVMHWSPVAYQRVAGH